MNAHQSKIIELKEKIERLLEVRFNANGDEVFAPKPGKGMEVERLRLRLQQEIEKNEFYGRAVSLLR